MVDASGINEKETHTHKYIEKWQHSYTDAQLISQTITYLHALIKRKIYMLHSYTHF